MFTTIIAAAAVLHGAPPVEAGPPSTWETIAVPAREGSMAPRIAVHGERALLSWLEPTGEAGDGDPTWTLRGAWWVDGALTPLTTAPVERDDLFVNWADTPGIVPGPGGSLTAHWLQKSGASTYAYDVRVAWSTDGGETWEPLGRLHADDQPVEHGFASFAPGPSGLTAVWLDGHRTGGGHGDHGHGSGGPMTLRTAHVSDAVRQELELDADVCDCCPTAIAVTTGGPVIAYRDRVPGDEVRDIAVVRWLGDRWSDPAVPSADDWRVAGCPVNGPALAARDDLVALAWYTIAPQPMVRVALSPDGGANFGLARDLFVAAPGTTVHGRPALAFDARGDLHLVHLVEVRGSASLLHQIRRADGTWSEPTVATATTTSRRSGVPVLARAGDQLLLATTTVSDDGTTRVELRRLLRD